MDFAWVLGLFFIFVTVAFMILAFFLPEWVGITGDAAKKITAHQQGTESEARERELEKDPLK